MANKLPYEIFDANDLTTSTRGAMVLYGRRADGSIVALQVDDSGILSSNASVSITPGDIQIGAVEIKDATTDDRAGVTAVGANIAGGHAVVNQPVGSSNSFFAETSAPTNTYPGGASHVFGFFTFSITIINEDSSEDLYVSFNGINDHMKLAPGEGTTMDYRRQSQVWMRSGTAATPVDYRIWAY